MNPAGQNDKRSAGEAEGGGGGVYRGLLSPLGPPLGAYAPPRAVQLSQEQPSQEQHQSLPFYPPHSFNQVPMGYPFPAPFPHPYFGYANHHNPPGSPCFYHPVTPPTHPFAMNETDRGQAGTAPASAVDHLFSLRTSLQTKYDEVKGECQLDAEDISKVEDALRWTTHSAASGVLDALEILAKASVKTAIDSRPQEQALCQATLERLPPGSNKDVDPQDTETVTKREESHAAVDVEAPAPSVDFPLVEGQWVGRLLIVQTVIGVDHDTSSNQAMDEANATDPSAAQASVRGLVDLSEPVQNPVASEPALPELSAKPTSDAKPPTRTRWGRHIWGDEWESSSEEDLDKAGQQPMKRKRTSRVIMSDGEESGRDHARASHPDCSDSSVKIGSGLGKTSRVAKTARGRSGSAGRSVIRRNPQRAFAASQQQARAAERRTKILDAFDLGSQLKEKMNEASQGLYYLTVSAKAWPALDLTEKTESHVRGGAGNREVGGEGEAVSFASRGRRGDHCA